MKVKLLITGKPRNALTDSLVKEYKNRLKHYLRLDEIIIDDKKIRKIPDEKKQKQAETLLLQKNFKNNIVLLLDENGQEYTSEAFSKFLMNKLNIGREICFVIGGPFGFSDEVYELAEGKIALSKMTFNHEMARLFFLEQLYRAMTIIRGEKYHNG